MTENIHLTPLNTASFEKQLRMESANQEGEEGWKKMVLMDNMYFGEFLIYLYYVSRALAG